MASKPSLLLCFFGSRKRLENAASAFWISCSPCHTGEHWKTNQQDKGSCSINSSYRNKIQHGGEEGRGQGLKSDRNPLGHSSARGFLCCSCTWCQFYERSLIFMEIFAFSDQVFQCGTSCRDELMQGSVIPLLTPAFLRSHSRSEKLSSRERQKWCMCMCNFQCQCVQRGVGIIEVISFITIIHKAS